MSDTAIAPDTIADRTTVERTGAGQDPRKRRQILEGARRLFLAQGFDAASMGDIAREAGVSKGTLYVYFDSKERLFTSLVREEKEQQSEAIFALDPANHDVRAVLTRVGRQFARFLTQPHVVMATRTIIAMGERMPEIAADFYQQGPRFCSNRLSEYLSAQVAAGVLAIDDTYLAAVQFLDMSQSTLTRPLLFGVTGRPSEERIDEVVGAAVDVFVRAYAKAAVSPA
jgi:AcrR family transcriptional regulator